MAITTASQNTAAQIQLLGRDVYNKAGLLIGTIVTLQSAITNNSARNQCPDIVDYESKLTSILSRLQILLNDVSQANTDLTIP